MYKEKLLVETTIETNNNQKTSNSERKIVWHNVIIMGLIHLAGFYGMCIKFTGGWMVQILMKILTMMSCIGVTSGTHRLWCHKTYKANNAAQIILMIMKTLTYQNSIYIWCRDHRLHHKYSETDADPHNANRGFFFSHMGWLFVRKHPDVLAKGKEIDMSDLEANPIVMFQHKYYYYLVILFTGIVPFSLSYFLFNESFIYSIFTCVFYRLMFTLNATWGINSFAHLYGNKPYDASIGPAENSLMEYLTLGEGFHNYHHTFPWDYKAAEYGSDVRNLATVFIDMLAYFGMVTDRRTVPNEIVAKRVQRTGDEKLKGPPSFFSNFFILGSIIFCLI